MGGCPHPMWHASSLAVLKPFKLRWWKKRCCYLQSHAVYQLSLPPTVGPNPHFSHHPLPPSASKHLEPSLDGYEAHSADSLQFFGSALQRRCTLQSWSLGSERLCAITTFGIVAPPLRILPSVAYQCVDQTTSPPPAWFILQNQSQSNGVFPVVLLQMLICMEGFFTLRSNILHYTTGQEYCRGLKTSTA